MRYAFLSLVFCSSLHASDTRTLFLHLTGQYPKATNDEISTELQSKFLTPLEKLRGHLIFSQLSQVYGPGKYFLNLIVEPTPSGQADVDRYIQALQGLDFHGVKVQFQKVLVISETAQIQAGNYIEDPQDPFHQTAQIDRGFSFHTLQEWLDFTNGYGYALMKKDNAEMMNYIRGMVGNDSLFLNFRDQVLSVSDMMAVNPRTSVVLEDGTVSGPEFEGTPFLPYKFFRNCFSTRFENGMCWKP